MADNFIRWRTNAGIQASYIIFCIAPGCLAIDEYRNYHLINTLITVAGVGITPAIDDLRLKTQLSGQMAITALKNFNVRVIMLYKCKAIAANTGAL